MFLKSITKYLSFFLYLLCLCEFIYSIYVCNRYYYILKLLYMGNFDITKIKIVVVSFSDKNFAKEIEMVVDYCIREVVSELYILLFLLLLIIFIFIILEIIKIFQKRK